VADRSAEPFGLGPHLLNQLRTADTLGETWIVLDVRGEGQLAAGLVTFEDQGIVISPTGVNSGRKTGDPAPRDNHGVVGLHATEIAAISTYRWRDVVHMIP